MDLSVASREAESEPFQADNLFGMEDLPVVPFEGPESYCRLCLTTPEVEPLFPAEADPNVYVVELIGKYIGIDLSLQDDFQSAVCRHCQLVLDQFDLFRQNCLKVDIAIRRRRLGLDVVVKAEPAPEPEEEDNEDDLPFVRLENRTYQCKICSELFRSMTLFSTHCKEEHPEESKMFKCKQCNKAFMTKTARLQHIRSHLPSNSLEHEIAGDRIQVCEKCMITFDSYKLLKVHIKEQHASDPKQEPLVCKSCSKQFTRITILRNHILRVHLGKLPHMCRHCGIGFGYTQQLLTHLRTEHGITDNINQLGQSLPTDDDHEEEKDNNSTLTGAVETTAIKETTSDIGESLQQTNSFTQQQESPTKTTFVRRLDEYNCTECQIKCNSKEDLRIHSKMHQDPSWWKCMHCRNFVKHQKMHIDKKHPSLASEDLDSCYQLRYRCWFCRMYFKSLPQMHAHAQAGHQVTIPGFKPEQIVQVKIEAPEVEPIKQQPQQQPTLQTQPETSALLALLTGQVTSLTAMPGVPTLPQLPQPSLPFAPENLPLLLSQLDNGGWDYLREFSRLLNPNNVTSFGNIPLKQESEPLDNSSSVMDLSSYSNDKQQQSLNSSGANQNSFSYMDDDEEEEPDSEDDSFIRLGNRMYQCKSCTDVFRHMMLLRKHTKVAHPSEWKSFKCPNCKRRFPSASIRDRHAHFHTLNHPHKCSECDQMYNTKKKLEQHHIQFHAVNSSTFTLERLRCELCFLSFAEKKYYDLHSRIFHQNKPQRIKNLSDRIQVCERCVVTFDSKELLLEHMKQVHHSDPPLEGCVCPRCSKDLKTVTLLRIHILVVHLGHLPFVCQHCNAAFATRHWLLKHVEKEHGDKPSMALPPIVVPAPVIKCPSCEETFEDMEKLGVHQEQAHPVVKAEVDPDSGSTVYPCPKCVKKLESKEVLEKHILKAHPTFMLMYKCPLCQKPVRYRKQHLRIHHDIEYNEREHLYETRYKCHCCSKLFKDKRSLSSHQSSLSHQCARCQMRFKTKKNLLAHLVTHRPNKSLKCEECGLEFGYRTRLEEHRLRFHSANSTEVLKLLNCPFCPKLFMSPSNRERHISVTHPQDDFTIACGHCDYVDKDSLIIRKHYRTDHPNERCTFKCALCVKIYLNLSSYKEHYKKHSDEAAAARAASETSNNSGNVSASTDVTIKVETEESQLQDTIEKPDGLKQEPLEIMESNSEQIIKTEPIATEPDESEIGKDKPQNAEPDQQPNLQEDNSESKIDESIRVTSSDETKHEDENGDLDPVEHEKNSEVNNFEQENVDKKASENEKKDEKVESSDIAKTDTKNIEEQNDKTETNITSISEQCQQKINHDEIDQTQTDVMDCEQTDKKQTQSIEMTNEQINTAIAEEKQTTEDAPKANAETSKQNEENQSKEDAFQTNEKALKQAEENQPKQDASNMNDTFSEQNEEEQSIEAASKTDKKSLEDITETKQVNKADIEVQNAESKESELSYAQTEHNSNLKDDIEGGNTEPMIPPNIEKDEKTENNDTECVSTTSEHQEHSLLMEKSETDSKEEASVADKTNVLSDECATNILEQKETPNIPFEEKKDNDQSKQPSDAEEQPCGSSEDNTVVSSIHKSTASEPMDTEQSDVSEKGQVNESKNDGNPKLAKRLKVSHDDGSIQNILSSSHHMQPVVLIKDIKSNTELKDKISTPVVKNDSCFVAIPRMSTRFGAFISDVQSNRFMKLRQRKT
ncbi:zinc finger protein 521-like [Uranotaenia lowii]|uniref:zinc finger protein 521-like n=1 Tax=Uranotaenia lowii TaxID=190385 RepID=UPI0024796720|nr:zinc finger protein 521-like [Uranotaenia lowii]